MKNIGYVVGLSAFALAAGSVQAETIYGITGSLAGGNLVSFDSANPGASNNIGALSGVVAGHGVRGIDFRPATGELFAISTSGSAAQLYTVNLLNGALTTVGSGFTLGTTSSTRISMDFNPSVDRIRIVTGDGQNFRANPDNGALVLQDGNLVYDANDSGAGFSPLISGIAYTNNIPGGSPTTLYGYDFVRDVIVTIGGVNGVPGPNGGALFTVGASGFVSSTGGMGFDISGATGTAYLTDAISGPDQLYTVNLATGAATQAGLIGADILDIAVLPAPGALALMGLAGAFASRRRRA